MIKLKKWKIRNFTFLKKFTSGICLSSYDILLIKKKKFNLNNYIITFDKKFFFLNYKRKKIFLLLNKKEIIFLSFFLKKKRYKCIPFEILKINSFFKLIIYLIKGNDRF